MAMLNNQRVILRVKFCTPILSIPRVPKNYSRFLLLGGEGEDTTSVWEFLKWGIPVRHGFQVFKSWLSMTTGWLGDPHDLGCGSSNRSKAPGLVLLKLRIGHLQHGSTMRFTCGSLAAPATLSSRTTWEIPKLNGHRTFISTRENHRTVAGGFSNVWFPEGINGWMDSEIPLNL